MRGWGCAGSGRYAGTTVVFHLILAMCSDTSLFFWAGPVLLVYHPCRYGHVSTRDLEILLLELLLVGDSIKTSVVSILREKKCNYLVKLKTKKMSSVPGIPTWSIIAVLTNQAIRCLGYGSFSSNTLFVVENTTKTGIQSTRVFLAGGGGDIGLKTPE